MDAVRAAGVAYGTAFDQRFHPAHVALRGLIEDGTLGTVTAVRIRYACWTGPDWAPDERPHDNWRADPDRAGGGAFLDLAPHGLDLTQVLLGEPITRRRGAPPTPGSTTTPSTTGPRSSRGRRAGRSSPCRSPTTAPTCSRAASSRWSAHGRRALAVNTMGQTPGGTLTLTDAEGGVADIPFDAEASPFRLQVEAFADALLRGEPFPFSADHDLHTMRLLDAAMREPSASVAAPPQVVAGEAVRPSSGAALIDR